jgi:hypothetical protein
MAMLLAGDRPEKVRFEIWEILSVISGEAFLKPIRGLLQKHFGFVSSPSSKVVGRRSPVSTETVQGVLYFRD